MSSFFFLFLFDQSICLPTIENEENMIILIMTLHVTCIVIGFFIHFNSKCQSFILYKIKSENTVKYDKYRPFSHDKYRPFSCERV